MLWDESPKSIGFRALASGVGPEVQRRFKIYRALVGQWFFFVGWNCFCEWEKFSWIRMFFSWVKSYFSWEQFVFRGSFFIFSWVKFIYFVDTIFRARKIWSGESVQNLWNYQYYRLVLRTSNRPWQMQKIPRVMWPPTWLPCILQTRNEIYIYIFTCVSHMNV